MYSLVDWLCQQPPSHDILLLPRTVPASPTTCGIHDTLIEERQASNIPKLSRKLFPPTSGMRENRIPISPCSSDVHPPRLKCSLLSLPSGQHTSHHMLDSCQTGSPSKQQSVCSGSWVAWGCLVLLDLLFLSASHCSHGNTTHRATSFGCLRLIRFVVWWFTIEIWVTKN